MRHFFTGFLCGAVIALFVAAAGALFVTESPVPFMTKIQSSSSDFVEKALQDRSRDPNEKLYTAQGSGSPSTDPLAAVTAGASKGDKAPVVVQPQSPEFLVHVGSYKTPDAAETVRAKIAFAGLDSSSTRGNDGYYRVRVGPFETEKDAQKVLNTLKDNDIPGQIIR